MNMDFYEAVELINHLFKEIGKRKLWEMWLTMYPNMDKKTFVSFDDFYKRSSRPISTETDEEIMKSVYEIRKKVREQNGNI